MCRPGGGDPQWEGDEIYAHKLVSVFWSIPLHLLTVLDRRSTHRARAMFSQPHVNTFLMEFVMALQFPNITRLHGIHANYAVFIGT